MTNFSTLTGSLLGAAMATFGTAATYQRASGGSPFTVSGVFDYVTVEEFSASGAPSQSKRPSLGVKLADFPAAPVKGDTLTVNSIGFRVSHIDEDGQGGAMLILQKT